MWPSFVHLFIPFQYSIHAMDFVMCGHHCTFPTVHFLLFSSACFLASELSLSMSSYSCCCFPISLLCLTCFVKFLMHSGSWCKHNCSWSVLLYLWMMQGSLHFNLLACSGVDSSVVNHPNAANGRSIQTA